MKFYHIIILLVAAALGALYYNRFSAITNITGLSAQNQENEQFKKQQQDIYNLIKAASEGNISSVEAFLTAGIDPNGRDAERHTPLMYASWNGHDDICRMLLSAKANPELRDRLGFNSFDYATSRGLTKTVDVLLTHSGKQDTNHYREFARIMHAAYARNPALLPPNVKAATLNRLTPQGQSPLHVAASQGDGPMVEALLARGASINMTNHQKQTALHWAAWNNQPQVIALLVGKGASVGAVDEAGDTPLHLAVNAKAKASVATLLDMGADRNVVNKNYMTPSLIAQRNKDSAIIALLNP